MRTTRDLGKADAADRSVMIEKLLASLGLRAESFQDAIAWSLCEHLVAFLAVDREYLTSIKNSPRSLILFAEYVEGKTGRKWAIEDLEALRRRVYLTFDPKIRQPIKYEDWLRLLFTTPLKCGECGRQVGDR